MASSFTKASAHLQMDHRGLGYLVLRTCMPLKEHKTDCKMLLVTDCVFKELSEPLKVQTEEQWILHRLLN